MYRFKELREERGYSLIELSEKIGVNASTISRIENGQREAKADYVEAYAKHFNVSISYLLRHSDIRNENVIKDEINKVLMKHGFTGKPGEEKEIALILEKTLEIYKLKKGL